jgi:hypothetical protein
MTDPISYATPASAGTGRTPIGIIMFAASHILLGGVLTLAAVVIFLQLRHRPFSEDWIVIPVLMALASPMITGGISLLLKGEGAWRAAVASFTMLSVLEAGTFAYAVGMTVRYAMHDNADVVWAGLFAALTFAVAALCSVVLGYLAGDKARITFGLAPGETPLAIRKLRRVGLWLLGAALIFGPLLRNVRSIFPD